MPRIVYTTDQYTNQASKMDETNLGDCK